MSVNWCCSTGLIPQRFSWGQSSPVECAVRCGRFHTRELPVRERPAAALPGSHGSPREGHGRRSRSGVGAGSPSVPARVCSGSHRAGGQRCPVRHRTGLLSPGLSGTAPPHHGDRGKAQRYRQTHTRLFALLESWGKDSSMPTTRIRM